MFNMFPVILQIHNWKKKLKCSGYFLNDQMELKRTGALHTPGSRGTDLIIEYYYLLHYENLGS